MRTPYTAEDKLVVFFCKDAVWGQRVTESWLRPYNIHDIPMLNALRRYADDPEVPAEKRATLIRLLLML